MLSVALATAVISSQDWRLTCERTGFRETGRYAEAWEYCHRLAKASPYAKVIKYGTTPQGREMIALVISKDRAFTPQALAKSKKPLVFFNNGIHSGEIEGKDADLILAREILVFKKEERLIEGANLIIIPVFSVDAHERFGAHNRANQNGPREMGWRATAQNLNLNRDWLKADAPEMRAMVKLIRDFKPDFLVDNHTTDGGDWQYTVQYEVPAHPTMHRDVVDFSTQLVAKVMPQVEQDGFLTAPYFGGIDPADPAKGVSIGAFGPRYSTGYWSLLCRPSMLVETHVLKPYEPRVWGTYSINKRTIEFCIENAPALKAANSAADAWGKALKEGDDFVITAKTSPEERPWTYKGFKYDPYQSDVSGGIIPRWTQEKIEVASKIRDQFLPDASVKAPAAYLVPAEFHQVVELLDLHGIEYSRLGTFEGEAVLPVVKFSDVRFSSSPFESRFSPSYKMEAAERKISLNPRDVVVPVNQPRARLVIHMFEPSAPDCLVKWGFFNAFFEGKEYAEAYVMEPFARKMLEAAPKLKAEFEERLKDEAFAKNPGARLNWLYERSPYYDARLNVYPVIRLSGQDLKRVRHATHG